MEKFFITGTTDRPKGLIRWTRGDPLVAPFSRFDPEVDDFVPSVAAGDLIIGNDPLITEIPPDRVAITRDRIRVAARA